MYSIAVVIITGFSSAAAAIFALGFLLLFVVREMGVSGICRKWWFWWFWWFGWFEEWLDCTYFRRSGVVT